MLRGRMALQGNDRGYGGNAARVAPGRDSWQPLSPELGRSRPETEQSWTSRLADVSPAGWRPQPPVACFGRGCFRPCDPVCSPDSPHG